VQLSNNIPLINDGRLTKLVIFITGVLIFGILSGCSEKIVNSDNGQQVAITVDIRHPSSSILALATEFALTVENSSGEAVIPETFLEVNGAIVEGVIDSLPAGRELRFIIEARDQAGTIYYRGETSTVLLEDQVNTVNLSLSPVVPLVKFTPRYLTLAADSLFQVDISAFNIPDLYGIAYTVTWNDIYLFVDSVVMPETLPADIIAFDSAGINGQEHRVGITNTIQGQPIVDASGDAALSTFYFNQSRIEPPPQITTLTVQVTAITLTTQRSFTIDDIYLDDCVIETMLPAP
jgi:hypothetical protein